MNTHYALAGGRPGFGAPARQDLTRHDLPPNAGGHCYTEFRNAAGKVEAVFLTALLSAESPGHAGNG